MMEVDDTREANPRGKSQRNKENEDLGGRKIALRRMNNCQWGRESDVRGVDFVAVIKYLPQLSPATPWLQLCVKV